MWLYQTRQECYHNIQKTLCKVCVRQPILILSSFWQHSLEVSTQASLQQRNGTLCLLGRDFVCVCGEGDWDRIVWFFKSRDNEITADSFKPQSRQCTPSFNKLLGFFSSSGLQTLDWPVRSCLPDRSKGANSFRLMQNIFLLWKSEREEHQVYLCSSNSSQATRMPYCVEFVSVH